MRVVLIAAALLAVCLPAHARERRSGPDAGVPSIMVDEGSPDGTRYRPRHGKRAHMKGTRSRTAIRARRSIPVPAASSLSRGDPIGPLNRSISQQQQQLQVQQQNQFEVNQLRQEIQRHSIAPIGGGALGCPAGAIGC